MLALVQYHFLVLYTLTPQFSRIIVFFFYSKCIWVHCLISNCWHAHCKHVSMLVLAAQSTAVPQLLAWLSLEKHPVSRCCMLRRLLPKCDVTETSQCITTFPVALAGH